MRSLAYDILAVVSLTLFIGGLTLWLAIFHALGVL
jgi:hypothetical protein